MHCNLRSPDATPVLFRFIITTPCQVWSRWTHLLPYYSVSLLMHYVTLWPWPLTRDLDLWPLTLNICNASPITWSNFVPNVNAIDRRSAAELLQFQYLTYCHLERRVTYCARLWDNVHQVWPSITYPCLNYSVFLHADTLCHAVTLTSNFLTLKARGTSSVTWSRFVRNLS